MYFCKYKKDIFILLIANIGAIMDILKTKMAENIAVLRAEHKSLSKEHGDVHVADVTIGQVLGGMRGIPALLCDTSTVFPDEGLRIRNIPILDLTEATPEDVFYLLCSGEKPNEESSAEIKELFAAHSEVPEYVWNVLEAMPKDSHPMAMLNTAILAMEGESKFRAAYEAGTPKDQLWKAMLEDSLILLARITSVAAGVYRLRFNKGERIAPRKDLDWSANFANMLGLSDGQDKFADLVRMYLVLHSDHEAGNVSAATSHTVGSALSDVYYAVSAGLNGLAGPLHGLANQECLRFVMDTMTELGGVPSEEQLTAFTWARLNGGQVIPGYGHAVLRVQDPRFTAFYNFGKQYCSHDDVFQTIDLLYHVAPKVLTEQGKAKNVWPNVDAASGALLYHFGLTEFQFYTVMFAVSRAMGLCAQLTLNRGIMSPIVRPNALTTDRLKEIAAGK